MREVLSLYFLTFALASLLSRRRRPRWARSLGFSLAGLGVVAAGRLLADLPLPLGRVDDWWAVIALPLAYWAPAPLAGAPRVALERTLLAVDRRLGPLARPGRVAVLDPLLEAAYLMVYPMVPLGLTAVLWTAALPTSDGFWHSTLTAVLPCYGLLPLVPTRPPRAVESAAAASGPAMVRGLNLRFMDVFSNRWNTLPSAHAAGAVAVAVEVARAGSPLAPAFGLLAAGIALATVRGRYHYAADTLAGVLWALVAVAWTRT